jgi:hypothetical protein
MVLLKRTFLLLILLLPPPTTVLVVLVLVLLHDLIPHTKLPVDQVFVPSRSIPWRVFPSPCPRSVVTDQ